MQKDIVESNEIYTLWYYPEYKMLHHQVDKPLAGPKLREMFLLGLEYFEKYSCYKWLSDDRGNTILSQEDMVWGEKIWRPQVIAAGWQFWGLVFDEEVIKQIPVKPMIEEYKKLGLTAKVFNNSDDAFQWLISV